MTRKATAAPPPNDPAEEARQILAALDLLCDCGNLIERGGQEILVIALAAVDGRSKLRTLRRGFCSLTCEAMVQFEQDALQVEPLAVVTWPLRPSRWVKKP